MGTRLRECDEPVLCGLCVRLLGLRFSVFGLQRDEAVAVNG